MAAAEAETMGSVAGRQEEGLWGVGWALTVPRGLHPWIWGSVPKVHRFSCFFLGQAASFLCGMINVYNSY